MSLANKVIYQNGAIKKFEKPEVCEAIKVANANRWTVALSPTEWNQREARLKKEYEKNTKAPGPGEEHPVEKSSSVPHAGLVYDQNFDVERLRQENKDLLKVVEKMKEGNPALKEAAFQFNDALLDELRKKIAAYKKLHFYDTKTLKRKDEIIKELRDKNAELLVMVERMKDAVKDIDTNLNSANETNKCLNKKVVELTKIKGDLNSWISGLYICIHHNNDNYKYKLKRLGKAISKLNSIIHDKNAVLSDVAEELRLSKIREKNLTEMFQKYMKDNEELKKELADKVVDKIDAQALKSSESALAYKEEVIETLDKELAEAKHEFSSLKRPFRPDSTEAVVLFANAYAKSERKHLPCTDWRNDGKEVSATYILENGKKSKIALDFTGDEIIFSRTDPDKPRKDSLYSYKDKQLAEKDAVIADLCNELAATKKELDEKTHLVEIVRNASKDYCDYGVAANEFIKKLANLYVIAGSKGTISNKMFERCKNYQSYGFPAKFRVETKKEIDSIARGKENMKK